MKPKISSNIVLRLEHFYIGQRVWCAYWKGTSDYVRYTRKEAEGFEPLALYPTYVRVWGEANKNDLIKVLLTDPRVESGVLVGTNPDPELRKRCERNFDFPVNYERDNILYFKDGKPTKDPIL